MQKPEVIYIPEFIKKSSADAYFHKLNQKIQWKHQKIQIFGRSCFQPRLTAWYGDRSSIYTYSGLMNHPLEWFEELVEIKDEVQVHTQSIFNGVLCNLYRNGLDYMGFHRDDERELDQEVPIVSVSFGASRKFVLKNRSSGDRHEWNLSNGDLFIMKGATQKNFVHALPKTKRVSEPRINLTFRKVRQS